MGSLADHIAGNLYPNDKKLSLADRMIRYFAGLYVSTGPPPASLNSAPVGSTYTDISTGIIYTKTPTGWTALGSGGGGGAVTFPLLAPDSSPGAPTYSFASIPGAGMYTQFSELCFSMGGSRQLGIGGGGVEIYNNANVRSGSSGTPAFRVFGIAGQVGNLQEWKKSDNTLLASISPEGAFIQGINNQIGVAYTLVAADAGDLVTLTNAAAITLTVPQDSAATIPIGAYVDIAQSGAGQVTVAAGAGATLKKSGLTFKLRAQDSRATVQKIAANTWSLMGDLAAS